MVNNITIDTLEPFLASPDEKLHLSDIARKVKAPHPTARLWLNQLEKEGVLKKEYKGSVKFFQGVETVLLS